MKSEMKNSGELDRSEASPVESHSVYNYYSF